ncbi:MAG: hypothetical protein ACD_73C00771G0001 [uncultured bacterium]|nr:MAG: hypothetical protein ACD_73C00771G0001 [uncultured bacterium]
MKKFICLSVFLMGCLGFNNFATAGTKCELDFVINTWSFLVKMGKGTGTIRCDNGQVANVLIKTPGGGATFGKSNIKGHGKFTEVSSIQKLYGSYAYAESHAGAAKSASAQALTKGNISLAISGTGHGFDLGVAFGSFQIRHRK